jgi:hypothetical protein
VSATGLDAKPPLDPGFLRLRQARHGASQCCGPFSSFWSSSPWRFSSSAASAADDALNTPQSPIGRFRVIHSVMSDQTFGCSSVCDGSSPSRSEGRDSTRQSAGCSSLAASDSPEAQEHWPQRQLTVAKSGRLSWVRVRTTVDTREASQFGHLLMRNAPRGLSEDECFLQRTPPNAPVRLGVMRQPRSSEVWPWRIAGRQYPLIRRQCESHRPG